MMPLKLSVLTFFALLFCSCAVSDSNEPKAKEELFDLERLSEHMTALSSDEFQGRMPCSDGETKTLAYLQNALKEMGVEPANGSSYLQDVPLLEIEGMASESMRLDYGDRTEEIKVGDDFIIHSQRKTSRVDLTDSELVFCGYGIVAPEKGWNDFEGVDLKGKTAVVLINDPGFGSEDSTFFKGNTMTYYGRWTYKYENFET